MADGSIVNSVSQSVFDDRARFILAMVIILQFVGLIAYTVYSKSPLPDEQLLLGAEITFVSGVLGYYFGSSSGSNVKSKLMADKL